MKKFLLGMVAALLFATPALACEIKLGGAFVRASAGMANTGAGFVTIDNQGKDADKLIAARADISNVVELHTHIKDGEVMRMRKVDAIAVPAGGKTELRPGGDHIMFIDLKAPLKEGDKVSVTLVFEKCGEIKLEMPVLGIGAMAAPDAPAAMKHMGGGHMQ